MSPRATPAARARDLHAREPLLTQSQIAKRLRMDRRAVAAALKATGKRGRPPAGYVTVHLVVPRELLDYARARVEDGVYSSREDAMVAALEAELVPEVEMQAYEERVREKTGARGVG